MWPSALVWSICHSTLILKGFPLISNYQCGKTIGSIIWWGVSCGTGSTFYFPTSLPLYLHWLIISASIRTDPLYRPLTAAPILRGEFNSLFFPLPGSACIWSRSINHTPLGTWSPPSLSIVLPRGSTDYGFYFYRIGSWWAILGPRPYVFGRT